MNKAILMGRLTRDPDIRWTQGQDQTCVARYTLAVDRKYKKDGGQTADFIACVAFGRQAEFAEKYFRKGIKLAVVGRIQTGSYTNRDGVKVYTTDIVVEEQEFAESKAVNEQYTQAAPQESHRGAYYPSGETGQATTDADGFMSIPDGIDEELPFN